MAGGIRRWARPNARDNRHEPATHPPRADSAGTQGIVAASRSERLYAVSLVTAEATVRALLSDSPDQISLYSLDEVAERPRQCFEFPKND